MGFCNVATLSGSQSFNPGGGPLLYLWESPDFPESNVTLSDWLIKQRTAPEITIFPGDLPGIGNYTFTLTERGSGPTSTSTFVVSIRLLLLAMYMILSSRSSQN